MGVLWQLSEIRYVRHLNQYLTYSKRYVNIRFYIVIILSSCRQ